MIPPTTAKPNGRGKAIRGNAPRFAEILSASGLFIRACSPQPGPAREKLERVVLPYFARDLAGDDAVVEEELGDALDRLEGQRHVEARVADGLAGHGLGQPGLFRVDLGEALRIG